MQVTGNVFLSANPCGQRNTTYSYNAFVRRRLWLEQRRRQRRGVPGRVRSASDPGNYALLATSVLRDKGNPSQLPRCRPNGNKRPVGGAPDIGALEFR